jgi:cytoskeletal protein CcmA (bactofilin family)
MAVTRIKNNQITDATVVASSKLVSGSVTGALLSNPLNYSGDFTISGNLTVSGTTNTVDTTNTLIADPVIVLSRGETGTPSNDSGILIERGTSNNAAWIWDETNDKWIAITTTSDGQTGGALTVTAYANIRANALELTNISMGNINITGNTISSTNTNGNINLTPAGSGEVVASTLAVTDLTTNRVVYVGANDALTDDANLTFTGTTLTVTGTSTVTGQFNVDNIRIDGTVISTVANNDNISLTPNGTGEVVASTLAVTDLTTNRVVYVGANDALVDSSNLTFDGSVLTVTGTSNVVGQLNADNIRIDGTVISTYANNDNITLTPNGTGNVIVSTATSTQVFYAGTNKELISSANLTFNGTNLTLVNDIAVNGGDITTTAATFTVANANATTLNIGGAATTVNVGAATGTTIIKNDLQVDGNDIKSSTGNVAITLNNIDVTIAGNLTIQGVTTNVGTQDLVVQDSLIHLHTTANLAPLVADDGRDVGFIFHYYKTSNKTAGLVWANDTSALEYYVDATENTGNGTFTGTYGNIKAAGFTSTVTTGTAPFVVNSTTQVANLNAATAGTVTTAAQPNITSLGNLTIANIDNIQIDGNTISSTAGNIVLSPTANILVNNATANLVFYAGTNKELLTNTNLAFNGTTLTVTGTSNVSGQLNVDNIRIDGTVISTFANNDNISLTPNGTGEVIASSLTVSDLTATRVVYAGTNGSLTDNTNLTFSGTQLTVTGSANISSQANIGNININGNTISSINTNGNVNITANGTGYVIVNSAADSSDFIVNGNTTVSASYANIFYVKASTGQIGIGTNSPASNVLVDMDAFTTSVILPKGTSGQRPSGDEVEGMLRYNTSSHWYEFWNGTAWTTTTSSYTVIAADSFSGDGSTLAFTLSQSATSASVIISINGVVQIPGSAYGVSGTTLTFTEAPLTGDTIDVRLLTTTTTVTSIADLNTEVLVDDANERANIKVNGNVIVSVGNLAVLPGTDNTYNIGSGSFRWKNVYATNTTIQNADLAENYLADTLIDAATVVSFGGINEITATQVDMDTRVAGVVSTAPAHIMNGMLEGENVVPVALQGRVPCKVVGTIRKGDMMVSAGNGAARAEPNPKYGSVIGKALEDFDGVEGIIEIVVGRV